MAATRSIPLLQLLADWLLSNSENANQHQKRSTTTPSLVRKCNFKMSRSWRSSAHILTTKNMLTAHLKHFKTMTDWVWCLKVFYIAEIGHWNRYSVGTQTNLKGTRLQCHLLCADTISSRAVGNAVALTWNKNNQYYAHCKLNILNFFPVVNLSMIEYFSQIFHYSVFAPEKLNCTWKMFLAYPL